MLHYRTLKLFSGCLGVMYMIVWLVFPINHILVSSAKLFEMCVLFQGYHRQVLAHRTHHPCHETTQMHLSMEAHNTVAVIAIHPCLCLQRSSLPHTLPSSRGICMAMVLSGQVFPLL